MTAFLTSILAWFRAGYPDGLPDAEDMPLYALFAGRLSSQEVRAIAQAVIRSKDANADDIDIGVEITKITDQLPREEDVARVRVTLAAAGWPPGDPSLED